MNEQFDKQRLLDLIRTEYEFVERTLTLVPDNRMNHPNVVGFWSVKDTLAHLNAWQERTLRWIDEARAGQHPLEPQPGFGWDAYDAIDEQSYHDDKDRPLDDVLAAFRASAAQLYTETESLNEDELFGDSGVAAHFRDRLYSYIAANTYEHYQEHIPPIRAWLRDIAKFQTAENRPYFQE